VRFLWRWLKRLVLFLIILAVGLLAPIGYNEIARRSVFGDETFTPQIESTEHHGESATYLTYPE
jgi:hypothetical protein